MMMCSLSRRSLSSCIDDGRTPGRMVSRHLARCAACRRYGDRLRAIDAALCAQVESAPAPPAVGRQRPRGRSLVLAGGAATVLAAAYLLMATPAHQSPSRAVEASEARGDTAFALPDSVSRLFREVALTRPLERELSALEHDGRRGLHAILEISGL